jgi:hypothetical protein
MPWKVWVLVALAVALAIWVISPLKSFQDCIHERKNYKAYQALHNEPIFLIKERTRIRLHLACAVHVADVYQNALVTVSGIIVAFFTFTLWISTHRLWAVGIVQAEAARMGQRARVQVTPSWEISAPPINYGLGIVPPAPEFKFGTRMDNVGSTAAANLRNHIDYIILPGEMRPDHRFPIDEPALSQAGILGSGMYLLGPHVPPGRYVKSSEIDAMQKEKLNFYFFGWVKYNDGFTDTPERTTEFCFRVRVTGNPNVPVVFIPYGEHNKAT